MPRYYFHIRDSEGELPDDEGRQFDNLDAVRRAALEGARSLICADVREGRLDLTGQLEVVDEAGARVLVVSFEEAAGLAGREQR